MIIKSKFNSRCKKCGGWLAEGDEITRTTLSGEAAQNASADFEACLFDERQMSGGEVML